MRCRGVRKMKLRKNISILILKMFDILFKKIMKDEDFFITMFAIFYSLSIFVGIVMWIYFLFAINK